MNLPIRLICVSTVLVFSIPFVYSFDNGAALTPPMGFLTWNRYRCLVDCEKYPNDCVSEELILRTGYEMARKNLVSAGYRYLIIDDCWPEMNRTKDGKIIGDLKRFPSGMAYLGKRLKEFGIDFGLYSNIGTRSCKGYPSIAGYVEKDLDTYINEYGVKYIKMDGCNLEPELFPQAYINISNILKAKYPGIVYGCAWPDVTRFYVEREDYKLIAKHCNLWRSYDSIEDSAMALWHVIDYFRNFSDPYSMASGPGAWNDADMLIVGGYGTSIEQQKVQMALWSILPSPLMISTDVSTINQESLELLLNSMAISVNQDKSGYHGVFLSSKDKMELWCRRLSDGLAFAVVSRREDYPDYYELDLSELGIAQTEKVKAHEIFTGITQEYVGKMNFWVNPQGVAFYKIVSPDPEKTFDNACNRRKIKRH